MKGYDYLGGAVMHQLRLIYHRMVMSHFILWTEIAVLSLLKTSQCAGSAGSKLTRLLTNIMVPVMPRSEQNPPIVQEEVVSPS